MRRRPGWFAVALSAAALACPAVHVRAQQPAPVPPPAAPAAPAKSPIARPTTPVAGWNSAVDPAADLKGRPRLDLRLTIPIKHQTKCVLPERPSPFVAVCDNNAFGPKQWSLLNLFTGAVTPAFAAKMHLDDPSLSPDGNYLATKARGERGQPSALEIYAMKGGKQLYRITSGEDHWPPVPVGFTLPDQIVSFTNVKFKPHLQGWDLKTGNKVWEAALEKAVEPRNGTAVSPGGKFVAVLAEKKLTIFDAATGQPVNAVDLPEGEERNPKPRGLAFSPDGLELAAYCEGGWDKSRLIIWDLATGVVMTDQTAESPKDDRWARGDQRKFEYFADARLLRFSNHVIDRDTGKTVYSIPASKQGRNDDLIKAIGDDRVLIVSEKDKDRADVTVAALPKGEMDKALATVKSGGRSSDANLPPLTKPDVSAVRVALDAAGPPGWTLQPDAGAKAPAPPGGAIALRSQQSPAGDFWPKHVTFAGPGQNQLAVAYHLTLPKNAGKKTVVDRLSLPTGTTSGTLEFPEHVTLADLSADGKLVTLISGEDRVDVFSLATPGAAKSVLAFRPYEGDKGGAQVKFAAAVAPDQIVTVGQSGRLILWSLAGAKAVYEMGVKGDDVALSPNRKQLAIANGNGVSILDPLTGQVLASLSEQAGGGGHLAFHPDGTKLAHFATQPYPRLTVYDLTAGKPLGGCTLPKDAWVGPVSFTGPDHVIVAGYLCDFAKHLVVWKYQPDPFSPKARGQVDDRYWAFVKGEFRQPSALVPLALPHDDAKKMLAAINPNDFLVVRPGAKVSVTASVTGDAAFQQKVVDSLKQRATAAGLVVADNAPIRITATTTSKQGTQRQFHVIGGNPAMQNVTIPAYDCKVSISDGAQTLWEVSTMAGNLIPTFAHLKQGETVQMLVDKINANPGNHWYTTMSLPGTIAKPITPLPTSKFTLKGPVSP